jgi:hypothetical protein
MSIKFFTSATIKVKIGATLIVVLLIVVRNYIDFWLPRERNESNASIRGSIEKKYVTIDGCNRSELNLSSAANSSFVATVIVVANDDDNAGKTHDKYNYAEEENNMITNSSSIRNDTDDDYHDDDDEESEYEHNNEEDDDNTSISSGGGVQGGHWEYELNAPKPYVYSSKVCNATNIHPGDCTKTTNYCPSTLMNWIYKDSTNSTYPKFDVNGFRKNMRDSSILFLGSSLVRQQFVALVWTLGHTNIKWAKTRNMSPETCSSEQWCMHDVKGNITLCHRFMGSISRGPIIEHNYTLNHSLRGHGDSSCLLHDTMIQQMSQFDLVFAQGSVMWFAGLPALLNSTSSPMEWISKKLPLLYHDAMEGLLSKLSQRTKTVFVLGQGGLLCANKTWPEPFREDKEYNLTPTRDVGAKYGWMQVPKLQTTSLNMIHDKKLNVHVIDARDPLMQSRHAHPNSGGLSPDWDCLHFCMNSAALNIYLDIYWTEVFSSFAKEETKM